MAADSSTAPTTPGVAESTRDEARRRADRLPLLALTAIVLVAFAGTAYFTRQVTEWLVMTDEMQYVKLAIGLWQDGQIVPHIHGYYIPSFSQLYPILLAPVVGTLDMPTAFRVAHYLNAAIMASAAIPAYLLVRGFSTSRWAAVAGAALAVAVPYMAMALMLMTEVVGFPAFLWAVLAMHRSMSEPSPKRDALAFVAIGLAALARTQFMLLAPVFPLAVVVHETTLAIARRRANGASVASALREAGRRHVVLWIGVAVVAVLLAILAVTGRVASVLGQYAVAGEGRLLPPGIVRSSVHHGDLVLVAVGVIPAILGLGWAVASLLRPSRKALHAYAVLLLLVGAALVLQVASFDLRFVHGFLQTRYLAPLAPMLMIAMVACCIDERRRWIGAVAAAVVLSLLLPLVPYRPAPSPWFGAPDSAFHIVLSGRVPRLGSLVGLDAVTVDDALRWGTLVLGVALAALLYAARRTVALAATVAVVLVYGAGESVYVLDKMTHGPNGALRVSGGQLAGRDWIDRALPDGATVAIMPVPIAGAPLPLDRIGYFSQVLWWNTQFWNKSVVQSYATPGIDSNSVWRKPTLAVDEDAGRLVVGDHRPYVVVSRSRMRFALKARRIVAQNRYLALLEVPRSYDLDWSTDGIQENGLVGARWRMRVYGSASSATARRIGFDVLAPATLARPIRFVMRSGGRRAVAPVAAGGISKPRFDVCVPAGGRADVDVSVPGTPADARQPVRLVGVVADSAPSTSCQ